MTDGKNSKEQREIKCKLNVVQLLGNCKFKNVGILGRTTRIEVECILFKIVVLIEENREKILYNFIFYREILF